MINLSKAALKSIWTTLHPCLIPTDQHRRCQGEHHRHPNPSCMSTGEKAGPQISPKNDQNAKRSTFQKPSTELVQSADSCRQAPIRDLWQLESHLQSATPEETRHHATIYGRDNSVLGQQQKQKEQREATRRVHSTIWIQQLHLTCSKGNATECRPGGTGQQCLVTVSKHSTAQQGSETRAPPGEQRGGISEQRGAISEQRGGISEQRGAISEQRGGITEQKGEEYQNKGEEYQKKGEQHQKKGEEYQNKGEEYQNKGEQYQNKGEQYQNKGEQYQNKGEQYQNKGEQYQNKGEQYQNKGEQYQNKGEQYQNKMEQYQNKGEQYQNKGEQYQNKGEEYRTQHMTL